MLLSLISVSEKIVEPLPIKRDKNVTEHSQCGFTNLSSSLASLIAFLDETAGSLVIMRLISSFVNNPDGATECDLSKLVGDAECWVDVVSGRD